MQNYVADLKYLNIPLYGLIFQTSIVGYEGYNKAEWEHFDRIYNDEEKGGILNALKWATENPDHDFRSALPDMKPTNNEIHFCLCEIYASYLDQYGGTR